MAVVQVSEGGGHGKRDQPPSSQPHGGSSLGSYAQFFISADLRFLPPPINRFLCFGPATKGASGNIFPVKERKWSKKRTGLAVLQSKKKKTKTPWRTSSGSDKQQRENKGIELTLLIYSTYVYLYGQSTSIPLWALISLKTNLNARVFENPQSEWVYKNLSKKKSRI